MPDPDPPIRSAPLSRAVSRKRTPISLGWGGSRQWEDEHSRAAPSRVKRCRLTASLALTAAPPRARPHER